MMLAPAELVSDLKAQVLSLEDDLRVRVDVQPEVKQAWDGEYRSALKAGRTGGTWQAWRDDRVTQAAVAWVLTTVFIRFCEDNALLAPVWIAGPPGRRQEALDAQNAYFRANPTHTDREWLEQAIAHLRRTPATSNLVDEHSMLWTVSPSGRAVTALFDFWRERTSDGALARDFTDPELSTRFLGDLYEELSEYAQDAYALRQTPIFIEEFILDRTLTPALGERRLEGFKLIDPACGSGHFLLGAFVRLLDLWEKHAPMMEPRIRVQHALSAIHGVDVNPFAITIARFRLTVAALLAISARSLEGTAKEGSPRFDYHLVAGDSLLPWHDQLDYQSGYADGSFAYSYDDVKTLAAILAPGRYDVVVANPPYITVKDKALNNRYRETYNHLKGTYALTVPFMELLFKLAKPGHGDQPAGWVGQITSNSFMKREFGTRIIEDFLSKLDLREVIDTSGAYIPGHGTPTVILIGRNRSPQTETVRAVLGIRGEPGRPDVPARGKVWSAITDHINDAGYQDSWITATDLDRALLAGHPWSLVGGGAVETARLIERAGLARLRNQIAVIGRTCHTGADDAYFANAGVWQRLDVSRSHIKEIVTGDALRDWSETPTIESLFPYDNSLVASLSDPSLARLLWTHRTALRSRRELGGTHEEIGLTWYEWSRWHPERFRVQLGITFAEVATHNHFVLDRGGKVFKQTAPVIKLPAGATEDDHLRLLGVLNSSTACFWLKQSCHNKGSTVDSLGARQTTAAWENFYQFNGTKVKDLPLPPALSLERTRALDSLAQELGAQQVVALIETQAPSAELLQASEAAQKSLSNLMVTQQEELDWEVYRSYGLMDETLNFEGEPPEVWLGERAFEIVLARKIEMGEEDTAWFTRHSSTPITEIPAHWPADYRELVQRRIDAIESIDAIRLLEAPEYKRRWSREPFARQAEQALRDWLLERLEDKQLWFTAQGHPRPQSVGQLAERFGRDDEFGSVVELWTGRRDVNLTDALTKLLEPEAVPYLAAWRLKEPGMRKFGAWQETWDLQRREDRGDTLTGLNGGIPVPPKYTSADFRKNTYWQPRGKLDVPKERFIAYPNAGRPTDSTPLLGWAGWDHAQQSLALASIIGEREQDGATDEQLIPLVAGMAELQPWLNQWHADVDPAFGVSLAAYCSEELGQRARQVGQSMEQLASWRPPAATRKRRSRS